jgi:cysteine-S-conjugate beta-lyase
VLPFGVKTAIRFLVGTLFGDSNVPTMVAGSVLPRLDDLLAAAGMRTVHVPLRLTAHGYALDVEAVGDVARSSQARLLFLSNPHNPTGQVFTSTELRALARLCARLGVFVISDEAHCDLAYPDRRHVPWGAVAVDDRWIVLHSIGKAFNVSGLSGSFAILPGRALRGAVLAALNVWGYGEGSMLGDAAVSTALTQCDVWLDDRVRLLQARMHFVRSAFSSFRRPLPSAEAEAGFLVWTDWRDDVGGDDAAAYLYARTGVRALDGRAFGPHGTGHVRINVATGEGVLREALRRIAAIRR